MIPPGGGPPPHVQTKEEEAFYILEGEITFWVDDQEVVAPKGTYINMPKGVKHNFKNQTNNNGRILFFFAPAGIEGMFDEMVADEEMANNPEKMIDALNKVGQKYGVKFLEE